MDPIVETWVLAPDGRGRLTGLHRTERSLDPGQRLLPAVLPGVHEAMGVDRPVLEAYVPPGIEGLDRISVLLVLEPADDGAPAGTHPLDTLPGPLADRATTWIAELAGETDPHPLRSAWSRPGWWAETTGWVDRVLAGAGRRRTGPIRQQRTWPLSSVASMETDRGTVWLKASCPVFHAEPGVTAWLADRFPAAIPGVLAADPDRTVLLMEAMPGGTLRGVGQDEKAAAAVGLLATMQQASVTDLAPFRALGLPVRPLADLASSLGRGWDRPDPSAEIELSPGRMAELVDWVAGAAARLGALGLPETLVHGDFHGGNVGIDGDAQRIFDWSDAAIAFPLLDVAPWGQDGDAPMASEALWEAWVDAWADHADPVALRAARLDALGAGAAYQLVSLDAILRGIEPDLRHLLADNVPTYGALLDGAARGVA